MSLGVTVSLAVSQLFVTAGYLVGIRPEPLNGNVMRFYEGSAAVYPLEQVTVGNPYSPDSKYLEVDVTNVGLNGRDGGGLEDGHFYFYLLKSSSAIGIVASRAIYYSDVILPPGGPWSIRKLPYGHPYRVSFGGFPPAHIDSWPQPSVLFTDSQYSSAWMAMAGGLAEDWTSVSVSNWIPDNARVGDFIFQTRDRGAGVAGSCYVRSYSGQPSGILVGSTNPWAPFSFLSARVRVNSAGQIEYKCSHGSKLYIQVRGYSMTEPS